MDYNMEELMPIMSELARKHCLSRQSSSMSYEQAQALMEEAIRRLEERKKTPQKLLDKCPDN